MNFAKRISDLQEKHGESNYRLAKSLGVSQTTVANWKNGTMPYGIYLKAIADHYNVTVEELLGKKEE